MFIAICIIDIYYNYNYTIIYNCIGIESFVT